MKKFALTLSLIFLSSVSALATELRDHVIHATKTVAACSGRDAQVIEETRAFIRDLRSKYHYGKGFIEKDVVRILQAMEFAAKKHRGQTRLNVEKTPYIIHPIGVAHHLVRTGRVTDPDILIAALLHDTIEDTETTVREIKENFGARVRGFVLEVTDDKKLPKHKRKALQIEKAAHKSAGATMIKLADLHYNLTDLMFNRPPSWNKQRCRAYVNWAEQVANALPWVNANLKAAVDQVIEENRVVFGA